MNMFEKIEQTVERVNSSIRPGCTVTFTVEVEGESRLVIVAEVERRYQQIHPDAANHSKGTGDRRQQSGKTSTQHPLDIEDVIAGIRHSVTRHHDLPVYSVILLQAGTLPQPQAITQGIDRAQRQRRQICQERFLAGTLNALAESHLRSEAGPSAALSIDYLIDWLRTDIAPRILSKGHIPADVHLDLSHRGLMDLQTPVSAGGLELDYRNTLQLMQQLGAIDATLALTVMRSCAIETRWLHLAAVCLGGMKRCAQLMLNQSHGLNHAIAQMRLSAMTMAIATLDALIHQFSLFLDQGQSIPFAAYLACKTAATEFFWQSADALVQYMGELDSSEQNCAAQMLHDAKLLRIFGDSTVNIQQALGVEILEQGNELHQFLGQELQSMGIAENLRTAAYQIKDRYANFNGSSTAAEHSIGEVATWAILWAVVRRTLDTTPSRTLQQAFTWVQLQFEHQLFQALIPMPNEVALANLSEIMESVAEYTPTIGTPSKRRSLQTWLKNWIAQHLNIDSHRIDLHRSWNDHGLDSTSATQLIQDLNTWFSHSLQLDATLIGHFPTLGSLASHLDVKLNQQLVDLDQDSL
jgi:acyl carrier protein